MNKLGVAVIALFTAIIAIVFISPVLAPITTYNGASEGFVINGTGPAIGTTVDTNDDVFWTINSSKYLGNNVTFFYEAAGSIDTNIWDNTANGDWVATATNACNGTSFRDIATGLSHIKTKNAKVNTTGYEGIVINFTANTNALDAGEYLNSSWYDGTAWTVIFNRQANLACGTQNFTLDPAADNNANFALNLSCLHNSGAAERCVADDVRITGAPIYYTTAANITSKQISESESSITSLNVSLSFRFNRTVSTSNWYYEIYNDVSTAWEAGTTGTLSTTERTESIVKTTSIGNYINASGYVKVRLRTDTNISGTFQMQADYLNTTVEFTTAANVGFNITLPDNSRTNSNSAGNGTKDLNISSNANGSEKNVNPCVNTQTECQTASLGALRFNNSGDTNVKWLVSLNASLPSSIVLFGSNQSANPYNWSINSSANLTVNASIPVGGNQTLWIYANFTDAVTADAVIVRLRSYSNQT